MDLVKYLYKNTRLCEYSYRINIIITSFILGIFFNILIPVVMIYMKGEYIIEELIYTRYILTLVLISNILFLVYFTIDYFKFEKIKEVLSKL